MTTLDHATAEETAAELDHHLAAAVTAAADWGRWTPRQRAAALVAVADALDAQAPALVEAAMAETGLPEARLTGELKRTTVQLLGFADVLLDGSYLRIVIDRPDPDFAIGPKPDLRRWLIPLGPVLVYAASNFPFAFSVAGGDTASALAAGCPVVLKAHPGHPRTSRLTADIVQAALADSEAPRGTFTMITGYKCRGPRAEGSTHHRRRLHRIDRGRARAVRHRRLPRASHPVLRGTRQRQSRGGHRGGRTGAGEQIAQGFVASFTLGAGQFCTKPGILLLPEHSRLPERLAELTKQVPAARMLTGKIADGYRARIDEVAAVPASKCSSTAVRRPLSNARRRCSTRERRRTCSGPRCCSKKPSGRRPCSPNTGPRTNCTERWPHSTDR